MCDNAFVGSDGAASAVRAVCAALCGRRLRGGEGEAPFSLVAAFVSGAASAPSLAAQFARAQRFASGVVGADTPFPARLFARTDDGAGAAASAAAAAAADGLADTVADAMPRGASYLRLHQQQLSVWALRDGACGEGAARWRVRWRVESCVAREEDRAAADAATRADEEADRLAAGAAIGNS
jgi:hypothetical protein